MRKHIAYCYVCGASKPAIFHRCALCEGPAAHARIERPNNRQTFFSSHGDEVHDTEPQVYRDGSRAGRWATYWATLGSPVIVRWVDHPD